MQSVRVVGVAEETFVSGRDTEIARFVGKRTVYPLAEIRKLCSKEVLAILFRQAKALRNPPDLQTLIANGIVTAAPQSITKLNLNQKSGFKPT